MFFSLRRLFVPALLLSVAAVSRPAAESRLNLDLGPYPQIFSYRGEYLLSRWSDEELAKLWSHCDGVSMKFLVGDEMTKSHQYGNVDRYLDVLADVKRTNPRFMILEHFLLDSHLLPGTLDNPERRGAFADFFPGHYLYCVGDELRRDLSAQATAMPVSDPGRFQVHDYVRILPPGSLEVPATWRESEAVRVTAIDGGTLQIDRGLGCTKARAFPAGSRLLPHMKSNWPNADLVMINLTRHTPKDVNGRGCPEALAALLAEWYKGVNARRNGILDGFEFDVIMHYPLYRMFVPTPEGGEGRPFGKVHGKFEYREVDVDLDGRPDGGYPDGRPAWGIGTLDFVRALRRRLGNDPILIGDCIGSLARPVPYTNGLMNEDFPDIGGVWSFSAAFQRIEDYLARVQPALQPFVLNVNKPDKRVGGIFRFADKAQKLRYQIAANLVMGAAFGGIGERNLMRETDFRDGLVDEAVAGTRRQQHWLGHPRGPYRRVGTLGRTVASWDHRKRTTLNWNAAFFDVQSRVGKNGDAPRRTISLEGKPVQATRPDLEDLVVYTLHGAELVAGRNYTLTLPVRAESLYDKLPQPHHGIPYGCYVSCHVEGKRQGRTRALLVYDTESTIRLTLMPQESGEATIHLHLGYEPGTVELGPVTLREGSTDRFVREFEHGVALLNATQTPHTFDLEALFPGSRLYRIPGSENSTLP